MNPKALMLGILSLLLIISSCTKENSNTPTEEKLPEFVNSSSMNFKKNIEIQSDNRKNKGIVTVFSNNEAILTKFDASSFSLTPIFENREPIEQENEAFDASSSDFYKEDSQKTQVFYELKVIEQEEGALGQGLTFNTTNVSRFLPSIVYLQWTFKKRTSVWVIKGCLKAHFFHEVNSTSDLTHTSSTTLSASNNSCSNYPVAMAGGSYYRRLVGVQKTDDNPYSFTVYHFDNY